MRSLADKKHHASRNPAKKRLLAITASGIAIALALAGVLALTSQKANGESTPITGGAEAQALLAGVDQRGSEVGSTNSKVVLVEYGDLRCPACRVWAKDGYSPIMDRLVRAGTARFRFANNPVVPTLNPQSILAARANVAAAKQDKGFLFTDLFYRNQGTEANEYVNDSFLTRVATAAGLNVKKFRQDLTSDETAATVMREQRLARKLGLLSTPRFVIESPSGPVVLDAGAGPEEVIAATEAVANAVR